MGLLAKMLVKLSADSADFVANVNRAERKTKDFAKQSRKAFNNVAKAGGLMGVAMGAAAAVIVSKQLAIIDSTAKTADKLGMQTEALGGLRHAAELTGVSQDVLDKSLLKMNKSLGEAISGTGEAKRYLEAMNLPIAELSRMKPDEAFAKISGEINKMGTQAEKTAAATSIFGRSGGDLINTMKLGEEGIKATAQEAEALGMTLSRIDAAKVEAANDSMARAKGFVSGLAKTLTVNLAPYITAVTDKLVEAAKRSGGFKEQIHAAIRTALFGVGKLADAWAGLEMVWEALKLSWKGLELLFAHGLAVINRAITDTINGAIFTVNKLIEGLNLLPGVEFQPLDKVAYSEVLSEMVDEAEAGFAAAEQNLIQLATKPLPSEKFENWLDEVETMAEQAAESVAAAAVGTSGGSGGISPEEQAKRDTLARQIETLETSLQTEEQKLFDSTVRRAEMVMTAHESEIITQERQDQLLEQLAEEHTAKLSAIHAKGLTARQKFQAMSLKGQVKDVAGSLVQMTQATASSNKTMFAINKAASYATAIVNTAEGVTKTLAKYPGPIGIGLATITAAAGLAQIAAITATSFEGGGTAPSVTATGAGGTVQNVDPLQGSGGEPAGREMKVEFHFNGNVYAKEQLAEWMEEEVAPLMADLRTRGVDFSEVA